MAEQMPDNGANAATNEPQVGETENLGGDQPQSSEPFVYTYKTKADAEQGIQNQIAHIRQVEAENADMRARLQAAPTAQQTDEDAQFMEKLSTSFDNDQRDVVEKLIERKVSKIVAPMRQKFEEAENAQVINNIRTDFPDYNDKEIVENVKQKIREYAEAGSRLNLYDAYVLVKGRDAISQNKEHASRSRQDDYVDGGAGYAPREVSKGVNAQLDFLLGKRDPGYGRKMF